MLHYVIIAARPLPDGATHLTVAWGTQEPPATLDAWTTRFLNDSLVLEAGEDVDARLEQRAAELAELGMIPAAAPTAEIPQSIRSRLNVVGSVETREGRRR